MPGLYIDKHSELYKSIYTALWEDYKKTPSHEFLLEGIKRDYLNNFQYYLCDSWYDYTVEEMIKFYNDYRAMYAQRYFRREGLIYYGQDEYDDDCIDIHKVVWRKKKDYKDVELSAEEYLQRAKAKLEKKEEERNLKRN